MKTMLGSYTLRRQPKKRENELPQFEWNWVVRFYRDGKEQARTAKGCPVCSRVLKNGVWVVREGSCLTVTEPLKERADCDCQRAARKWAEAMLETETALLQQGEIQKLEELRTPKKWTTPAEVLKVYRERGPDDRVQRINFLASMYEQTTGKGIERLQWEDLTVDLKLDWAEMRQEAGRRGWLGLGAGKNMPEGGWAVLREMKRAGKLPALDDRTEAAWNTTIMTYMTSVNSIFGMKSRTKVLRGLNVPELTEFLKVRLSLPGPKGHKEIAGGVMKQIDQAMPALLQRDARVWLFHQLCEETGMRPVSVRRLVKSDLQVLTPKQAKEWRKHMAAEWRVNEDELCDFGGLISVAAAKHGNAIVTPISAEVVDVALRVMTETSLIGAKHVTEARELHAALNTWLRGCGVTGTHAAYLLRHRKGQLLRRFGGKTAVGAGLGHEGEAMAGRYSREDRVVPAVGLRKRSAA